MTIQRERKVKTGSRRQTVRYTADLTTGNAAGERDPEGGEVGKGREDGGMDRVLGAVRVQTRQQGGEKIGCGVRTTQREAHKRYVK